MKRKTITQLLELLKKGNEEDATYKAICPQKISLAAPVSKTIATLDKNFRRDLSPMLAERFLFSGTWTNAIHGLTLFGLDDLDKALNKSKYVKRIESKKQHWENSIFVRHKSEDISLLAADPEEPDEIYAVWIPGRVEPTIVEYFGQNSEEYTDLHDFLLYLTK